MNLLPAFASHKFEFEWMYGWDRWMGWYFMMWELWDTFIFVLGFGFEQHLSVWIWVDWLLENKSTNKWELEKGLCWINLWGFIRGTINVQIGDEHDENENVWAAEWNGWEVVQCSSTLDWGDDSANTWTVL